MILLLDWHVCHKGLWLMSTIASGLGQLVPFGSTTHRAATQVQPVSNSLLGVGCTFPLLRRFLLEKTFPGWFSGDLSCVFQESCAKSVQKPQEFPVRTNFKKAEEVYRSVGMQWTPSHSLLSEIAEDSVLSPKLCWGFFHLSCSKSFLCWWLNSCMIDQLMVTAAVFRDCNRWSQSSAGW